MQVQKLPFKKIFGGTPGHVERIRGLVVGCNRLVVHATHFAKFYILSCPATDQVLLDHTSYEVITSMLNDDKYGRHGKRCSEERSAIIDHFTPFMREYKNIVGYTNEYVPDFQQQFQYMSTLFATNTQVNVQENFVGKLKKIITEVIIRRQKGVEESELKHRATLLCEALFNSKTELNEKDLELYKELSSILPSRAHTKGLCYDVACRPLAYVSAYTLKKVPFQVYATFFHSRYFHTGPSCQNKLAIQGRSWPHYMRGSDTGDNLLSSKKAIAISCVAAMLKSFYILCGS